jgi:hypothetical protein
MIVYRCDLCDATKECIQKEIDGREYDICLECWSPLEEKLRGKGRTKKHRESVYLPPSRILKEDEEKKPMPGELPQIWYGSGERRQ